MKILLFLVAVVRAALVPARTRAARPRRGGAAAEPPQQMIACAHCGVHLPRDEALPGRGGVFCGDAHRTAFEKAQRNDARRRARARP